MTENTGNGFIKVSVRKEELEESIKGLSQLKPILQKQVALGNGSNVAQAKKDVAELGKHFDTAINAMTILYSGFKK